MKIRAFRAVKELNYSTQLIRLAAQKRNIQFKLLAHYQHHIEHELYTLSDQGRTHLMDITRPDTSSATAFSITKNKYVTQMYMKPLKMPHTNAQCFNDPEVALHHFKAHRHPSVIKPAVGTDSLGVSTNLRDESTFLAAAHRALQHYPAFIVEDYFEGPDYRLLFVQHRCIAISQRLPAFVEGDGESDIKTRIAHSNTERAEGRKGPLSKIIVDEDVIKHLHAQGRGMGTVPKAGERVFLRKQHSMDLGGVGVNLDIKLHPENHAMLSQLTESLGLQVAAIDIISPNLSMPFDTKKNPSAVLELISRPRLRFQEAPYAGEPIAASEAIIDMLFPETVRRTMPAKQQCA